MKSGYGLGFASFVGFAACDDDTDDLNSLEGCTGEGELTIRATLAHEVYALVKYREEDLQTASGKTIAMHEGLKRRHGTGFFKPTAGGGLCL